MIHTTSLECMRVTVRADSAPQALKVGSGVARGVDTLVHGIRAFGGVNVVPCGAGRARGGTWLGETGSRPSSVGGASCSRRQQPAAVDNGFTRPFTRRQPARGTRAVVADLRRIRTHTQTAQRSS